MAQARNRITQAANAPTEARGAPSERGVTLRSIVFGLVISVIVCLLSDTVRWVLHGSFMAYSHIPMGSLIPFLVAMLVSAMARKRPVR